MKISIITVVLNAIDTVEDCVNSVIKQNYSDIEYIVIDGGSSDGTLRVIKKKTKYISRLISEQDLGIYHAMNKGISLSTGDVVGILNADDFFTNENILKKIAKLFKDDYQLDACYSDLIYVDRKNIKKNIRYWKSNQFVLNSFSKGWSPPHPTFFVRKKIYSLYGSFNLNYKIAADNEIMMRFLEINKVKAKHIPEVWVKMRTGGISNRNLKNIWQQNLEIFQALNDYKLKFNYLTFLINKFYDRLNQFFLSNNINK